MDVQRLDVSSEVPLKSMTISERHNHSGSSSNRSLFSENVNGEVPTSAPDMSQRVERLKVNAERITKVHKVNDLGCEGDNISCISKVDGTNLEISGHNVDTYQKNVSGSSASVTSICQEGTEKPIDVQSVNHDSISSECHPEEGNKFRGPPEFARETLQSAADISDKSDPSETSSLRDEHGAVSPKVESVSPARDTDLLTTSQKCSHDCNDLWKSDAEIDSNQTSAVELNKLDEKQQSEMRMTEEMQEPPSQYRVVDDKEDSDELVDVRVCDICGDVGREALLAVCSKCGDGAEHIYCMRIKMDKVPDGDWMCEDCTIMSEAQKQKAEDQKIGRGLQKSSTNEVAQTPRKLDLSGDNGRAKMGHSSLAYSRKRPGPSIEVSPSAKKRALDNSVKLPSPSGSYAKAVSPRHANLKITTKGEGASSSGSNSLRNTLRKPREILTGRSSNVESQFKKGSSFKQKFSNSTDLRTERESEDVHREQKTTKGRETFVAGQRHALTKLMKSKSFTTSSFSRIDSLDSKKNMDNDFKIPKVGSKRSITQRSYSFNSKISQPVSPKVSSSISMAKPGKATPSPAEFKQRTAQTDGHHALKTVGVHKDLEKASIHRVAKRQCDTNGSGFDRKIPSSLADKGKSSGNSGKTSTVSLGQISDRKASNAEEEHKRHGAKHQLNDINKDHKVQLNGSTSGATVLLASSAHPDVDCVWRGMLNVECNKLPSCCSGLQAHLSTCASPKAFEVASKLPCEITVKEVLQQDIWPVQFSENRVTENDIALYFFAEDQESYRRYKRILNCMMLNDLALKANLDGIELLIFHSQVLPAKSRRWNNLFFLWGVFRAKRSSISDDVCVPSHREGIQIPVSESASSPKNPPVIIPAISGPVNYIPTQVGQGSSPVEVVSGSVLGSGSSSQRELQSSVSTESKCVEGMSVIEGDDRTMERSAIKEEHSGELQPTNEGQKENTYPDRDPEDKVVEALQTENTSPNEDPEAKTVEAFQTENASQDQDPEAKTVEAFQTEDTSLEQDPDAKTVEAVKAENTSEDQDPEAKTVEALKTENTSQDQDPEAKTVEALKTENTSQDQDPEAKTVEALKTENTSQDQDPEAKTVEALKTENTSQDQDPEAKIIEAFKTENTSQDQGPEAKVIEATLPCVSGAELSEQPTVGAEGMRNVSSVSGERHQAEIAFNYPCNGSSSVIDVNVPVHTDELQEYDDMNGRTISLNSTPSDSGGEGTSKKPNHHTFDLELPLLSENELENEGDSGIVFVQPNGNADHANVEVDGFVSLDLSLALPSTEANPFPMMEELLPDMDDGVDTSLSLSFGGKRA